MDGRPWECGALSEAIVLLLLYLLAVLAGAKTFADIARFCGCYQSPAAGTVDRNGLFPATLPDTREFSAQRRGDWFAGTASTANAHNVKGHGQFSSKILASRKSVKYIFSLN
ncbi:MAG: hypothetical protein ACLPPF_22070 [Rhodomicrobium sp.]